MKFESSVNPLVISQLSSEELAEIAKKKSSLRVGSVFHNEAEETTTETNCWRCNYQVWIKPCAELERVPIICMRCALLMDFAAALTHLPLEAAEQVADGIVPSQEEIQRTMREFQETGKLPSTIFGEVP